MVAAGIDGVVLLHGIARSTLSMGLMAHRLRAAGFEVRNIGYPSRRRSLDKLAEDIHENVSAFARANAGVIHFVTHSMGGLVARHYFARHRPQRLGRVVMLGPPNRGSELADRLHRRFLYRALYGPAGQQLTRASAARMNQSLGAADWNVGVIAGRRPLLPFLSDIAFPGSNDGMVTIDATRISGPGDHLILNVSHTGLLVSRAVVTATIAFLKEGSFAGVRVEPPQGRHSMTAL